VRARDRLGYGITIPYPSPSLARTRAHCSGPPARVFGFPLRKWHSAVPYCYEDAIFPGAVMGVTVVTSYPWGRLMNSALKIVCRSKLAEYKITPCICPDVTTHPIPFVSIDMWMRQLMD